MRKIEIEMNRSILLKRDFKTSNTEVKNIKNITYIYLHNNEIAKFIDNDLFINYEVCINYPTKTTGSRIRGLGVDFKFRNGEPIINSRHKFYNKPTEEELLEEELLNTIPESFNHSTKAVKF